eukprot:9753811-Alexandrium_andersonii.AAC.1
MGRPLTDGAWVRLDPAGLPGGRSPLRFCMFLCLLCVDLARAVSALAFGHVLRCCGTVGSVPTCIARRHARLQTIRCART